MPHQLSDFIIYVICYLLGSIPVGFIIAKTISSGDIRKQGSGNIGATNLMRVYGKSAGIATFIADCLKAIIALKIANIFGICEYLAAFIVVIGHIFPVWLKFKGGKGVATFFASLVYINIAFGVIYALSWGVIFFFSRMSSLASLISTLIILVSSLLIYGDKNLTYFILSISVLVIFTHRDNISRIIKGKELNFKVQDEKK